MPKIIYEIILVNKYQLLIRNLGFVR